MTIDMKNYAGVTEDSAAVNQQPDVIQTAESPDYPVHQEFLKPADEYAMPELPKEPEPVVTEAPQPVEPARDNFRALTDTVEKLKAEREAERQEFKQNLELLRANVDQQRRPPEVKPQGMFEGLGLNKTDVPTAGEIEQVWNQREAAYLAKIEELEVASNHSDYAEVIRKYTAPLIKEKPYLAQGIQNSQNRAQFAYELGKMRQELEQSRSAQVVSPQGVAPIQNSPVAEKIVANANKPKTLSSAGGQGALSHVDYYANMSDQDFFKMASKHLGDI